MNLSKLRGMIAEKGKTYKECSEAIHVTPQTFTKKMCGQTIFNIDELNDLGDFLGMTGKEKINIFLSWNFHKMKVSQAY